MNRQGNLVLLAGHCVYDRTADRFFADHAEDRAIHAAQLHYALQHLEWRAGTDPLLVISGGRTQAALRRSESRSYSEWAEHLGFKLPASIVLEEYALSSIENLLFGLYRYHQTRQVFPAGIDVISWGFKAARFAATMSAIEVWQPALFGGLTLAFFPVGDLPEPARTSALGVETGYCAALRSGVASYYADPRVQALLAGRDPWNTRPQARQYYAAYPLPF
jgi:hypothetical protein